MIKRWKNDKRDMDKIKEFATSYGIKWSFSTPLAPHHNGLVEALVKSVKNSLNKIINDRILTAEEYRTILMEIQNLINSRPVWPPNDGDAEDVPITCNDLLRPGGLDKHPMPLDDGNPKMRYHYIQKVISEWWKLWLRNFVPSLQVRNKWWKKRENVSDGDIVLLIDPNISRGKWQLGKVIEVFPGTDNRIRSVRVKTITGVYDRPITKLTLLMSKEEYEQNK